MSDTAIITNIQRCSTEDGPGIRTTVFFKGCPLKCIWCHNIETIDSNPQLVWHESRCIGDMSCVNSCPEHALQLDQNGMHIDRLACKICGTCEDVCPTGAIEIIGKERSLNDLVDELLRDKVFYDTSGGGVTLSGGEPLHQYEFAIKLADALREESVHVALDTTGYANENVWRDVLKHVDLVLLDLKEMDPEAHERHTGIPLNRVLENARTLGKMDIPVWIRTPIIPNHTDSKENIKRISRFILSELPNVERYDLLAFNKMCVEKYRLFGLEYPLRDLELISKSVLEELASVARNEGVRNVVWSGMTKLENGTDVRNEHGEVNTCG